MGVEEDRFWLNTNKLLHTFVCGIKGHRLCFSCANLKNARVYKNKHDGFPLSYWERSPMFFLKKPTCIDVMDDPVTGAKHM